MPKFPFDVTVEYLNGTIGNLHVWATDMRDALGKAQYWLSLPMGATKLTIALRQE